VTHFDVVRNMPGELVTTTGVADFMRASKAKNTQFAYASDLRHFDRWCAVSGHIQLPPDPQVVAAYLASLAATRKFATISRRTSALTFAYRAAGFDNPLAHPGVKTMLQGIARTLGRVPFKKTALTAELLGKVLRKIGPDLSGLRDKALLLLGFSGVMRRSELVALNVADVTRHPRGALLIIRRSKTDQTGTGLTKAIPHGKRLRAIEALDAWLIASRICDGPIFRPVHGVVVEPTRLTTGQVARIVKKRAARAGLDPKLFSGHSLRSGYITSAAEHGASLSKIADQAGHAKLDTTRAYVQVADSFRDHSGRKFL
jgi:integrase